MAVLSGYLFLFDKLNIIFNHENAINSNKITLVNLVDDLMGRHSLFTLCELVDVMTWILLCEEFSYLLRIGGEKFRQSRIKYIDSLHRFIFWERIYHLRTLLFVMTFHLTKGALSPKVRHEVRNW